MGHQISNTFCFDVYLIYYLKQKYEKWRFLNGKAEKNNIFETIPNLPLVC